MIRVAICEDEVVFMEKIKKDIAFYFSKFNKESTIDTFNSGEDLIKSIDKEKFNIYFLDIEIGEEDGVRIAEYIRKRDKNAILIFVTNKNERVYEVFSLDTFGFVRKDHLDKDFPEIMKRLEGELENYISKLIIQGKDKEYLLTLNDILYFERVGGLINIKTKEEEIVTKYRYFTELPFSVDIKEFGEIYRGIYINYKYLEGIDTDEVRLTGGIRLPISRRKKKMVKENYKRYLLNS